MPRYMLLIYDDEKAQEAVGPEDAKKTMDAYYDFTDEVVGAGVAGASDALLPTATAKTVRVRDGERLVTDGPFAETKEQLGGFYVVECDTEEEALEWAAKIPSSLTGSIEVRRIMEVPPRETGARESDEVRAADLR